MIKFLEVRNSAAGLKIKTNSNSVVVIRIFFYSIFDYDQPKELYRNGGKDIFTFSAVNLG